MSSPLMASSNKADNSFFIYKEFQLYPYPTHVNTANFLSIKLSGKTNYRSWQEQMMCLLDSHDMLGFIDGTIKCNQGKGDSKRKLQMTDNTEYRIWKRSDTLVKGWIFGSLTEDVMDTVVGLHTSHHVWKQLKKSYDMLAAPTSNTVSNQDLSKYRPLYGAVVNGHWEKAREYFNKDKDALTAKINDEDDSPLHIGIGTCQNLHFVENLLKEINSESLQTLVCQRKQNPLHRAALAGNTEAAKMLVEKNQNLLFITDKQRLLPIHRAIFGCHVSTFLYLLKVTKEYIGLSQLQGHDNPFKGLNAAALLTSIIGNGLFEVAYELIKEYPDMARTKKDISIPLKSIAGKSDAYLSGTKYNFYQNFVYHRVPIQDHNLDNAHEIDQDIENQVLDVGESACNKVIRWIYVKLWKVLLLHGQLAPIHKLNMVSGAALQMQRELQWFEEVKKFALNRNSKTKNKKQETPIMVFRREHEELRKKGEEWMKKTADSYTITAALIITIVFAAAITVPGGTDGNTGKAIYATNPGFIIFVVSDAISLFTSTTSLLLCLSILTTRYRDEDFLYRLPKRLMFGLGMLFLSVTFMMIAFSATLYIMFAQGKAWTLFPIVALTGLPVFSFVKLQRPLLFDLISSTYGQGIFGKQK